MVRRSACTWPRRASLLALALVTLGLGSQAPSDETRDATTEAAADTAAVEDERALVPASGAVTLGLSGVNVRINPETGRLEPPTPAEANRLAAELRRMFKAKNPAAKHRRPETRADGTLSMVLDLDHLSFSVARVNDDGTLSTECVPGLAAAGDFLASGTQAPANEEE